METVRAELQGAFAEAIGPEHGITTAEWEAVQPRLCEVQRQLVERRALGQLGFADLPFDERQLDTILPAARQVRYRFDNLVVLGIGGSSLGLRALTDTLLNPALTMGDRLNRRSVPNLYIFDTVDPDAVVPAFEQLDWGKTCINIVSKSGKTAETGALYLIVRDLLLKRYGAQRWKDHVIITTDPAVGPLRAAAICEGIQSFEIPPGVGGRFSCLTPAALFPAACVGVEIAEVLTGARAMAQQCLQPGVEGNMAVELAAVHFLLDTAHQKSIAVLMPYINALQRFTDWYVQLWAESIGKHGQGQTPLRALGAGDQHAQLQLFADGPNNKVITFLTTREFRRDIVIPLTEESAYAYLPGTTLGGLLNAEATATRRSLQEAGRPTVHIEIPRVSPAVLGQLLFCYEWQVAVAAELYGINAFDQPAVERSKQLTRELLSNRR